MNFENRFTFAKVMIKNQVSCFFETQCRLSLHLLLFVIQLS